MLILISILCNQFSYTNIYYLLFNYLNLRYDIYKKYKRLYFGKSL